MSDSNTSLLPARVAKTVQPPPKKHEIIEALAQIKLQQLVAENSANRELADQLCKECEAELRALMSQKIAELASKAAVYPGNRYTKGGGGWELGSVSVRVDFETDELPAPLRKKLLAYHAAKEKVRSQWQLPKIADCRKAVREAMAAQQGVGGDRVKVLLDTPEVKKALTQMLGKLEDAAEKSTALTIQA